MKKLIYTISLLALATSCSDTTDEAIANEVSVVEVHNYKIQSECHTKKLYYDNQNRLSKIEYFYTDGNKSVQNFTYAAQSVNYDVDFVGMKFIGSYHQGLDSKVDSATDVFEMDGRTISGGTQFIYTHDQLVGLKNYTVPNAAMPARDTMFFDVKWNADNLTDIACDWTKYVQVDEQMRIIAKKEYNTKVLNNANIDLNFFIERHFQNGSYVSYDPLTIANCGKRSKNMMSKYTHVVEFKNNKERGENLSFNIEYVTDSQGRVKEAKVLDSEEVTYVSFKFKYN